MIRILSESCMTPPQMADFLSRLSIEWEWIADSILIHARAGRVLWQYGNGMFCIGGVGV